MDARFALLPLVLLLGAGLSGCVTQASTPELEGCTGSSDLPAEVAWAFYEVSDDALLSRALGQAGEGGLCKGRVYVAAVPATVRVYRAWNSTYPGSRLGKWWSFSRPSGRVAQYRSDFEICYQFSPLDKLTECTLTAQARVAVGTGQSVKCSDYLSYPVSPAQQVYIEMEKESPVVSDCTDYDALFSWQPANTPAF